MRKEVAAFLKSMGMQEAETDPLLDYVLQNTTSAILNIIHSPALPKGLECVAVYRAAGEYLHLKKGAGQLTGFDLEAAIKQIKEGDTSVTFALGEGSKTQEQRLESLISLLMTSGNAQLIAYRRFQW